MKLIYAVLLCLLFVVPSCLFAQQDNEVAQLFGNMFAHNDTLTSSYSGFVHGNWTQAGIGINVKRLLLMWNTTVLPIPKNYKTDITMDDVTSQDPMPTWDIKYKYDTIMVGYLIRLSSKLYPYAGTGTAVRTDMVEVHEANGDEYTVKGKSVTFATGIVGVIYAYKKNVVIEGSVQLNPLLPFAGVGLRF